MSSNSALLLQATGLTRKVNNTAVVDDVSLSLESGDILGLLGLNGAGKTTTLRMLAGVLSPDEGQIQISGHSLFDEPMAARRHLGFLPDTPPVYPDLQVVDYLRFAAKLRRVPRAQINTSVDTVLQRCELSDVKRKRIGKLSKGFQQRVGLAQALIHNPAVVLLDEPSNGLDPQQMQSMRDMILETAQQSCVVFSTHLLSEVTAVCNRIAVMHGGKIVHDQKTTENLDELQARFNQLVQSDTGKQIA